MVVQKWPRALRVSLFSEFADRLSPPYPLRYRQRTHGWRWRWRCVTLPTAAASSPTQPRWTPPPPTRSRHSCSTPSTTPFPEPCHAASWPRRALRRRTSCGKLSATPNCEHRWPRCWRLPMQRSARAFIRARDSAYATSCRDVYRASHQSCREMYRPFLGSMHKSGKFRGSFGPMRFARNAKVLCTLP